MELAIIVGVVLLGVWAARWWETHFPETAMAPRRIDFHESMDAFRTSWTYDFGEMRMLYKYRGVGSSAESSYLYLLRRSDGARWEIILHPETTAHLMAQIERSSNQMEKPDAFEIKQTQDRRDLVRMSALAWNPIDRSHAEKLETQYQLFRRSDKPADSIDEPLDVMWRRLVQLERPRENHISSPLAQMKVVGKARESILYFVRHVALLELYKKPEISSAELYERSLVAARSLEEHEVIEAIKTMGGVEAIGVLVVFFGAKYRIGIAQVVAEVINEVPDADHSLLVGAVREHLGPAEFRDPMLDLINIPGLAGQLVDGYADDLRNSKLTPEAWLRNFASKALKEADIQG